MADKGKDSTKKTTTKTSETASSSKAKAAAPAAASKTAAKSAPAKATAKPSADKTAKPAAKTAAKTTSAKATPAKAADKKTATTSAKPAKEVSAKKDTQAKPAAKAVKEDKPVKADSKATAKAGVANAAAASTKKAEPVKDTKSAKKEEPAKESKPAKKEEPKQAKKEEKPAKKEEKPAKKSEDKKSSSAKKDNKKTSKVSKSKEQGSGKAAVAAAVLHDPVKRNMIIIAAVLIFVLLMSIIIVSAIAIRNHKIVVVNPYKSATRVGYSARILGEYDRVKPVAEVKNEGLSEYPTYGYTLSSVIGTDSAKVAARNALIAESSYLTATGTSNAGGGGYTWIDENGYLYSGTRENSAKALGKDGKQRQLYQHTASIGLYLGDKEDSTFAKEKGVIKEITMMPRTYGYSVTGLYAPAGEVIKVTLTEEDMKATGGIIIHIGQALYNGQANNIWDSKNAMNRIPHLLNTLQMNTNTMEYDEETGIYTGYIGSFIGGPIYVRNESQTYSVTISGGLTYSHFILGYTTPEEFEENNKSTVPYFDLEVWEYGCLHSGPKTYAAAFDYEQLYNAAVLWEKVSLATTSRGNGSLQGIVFLYDPFVAAGAAVAFPGRSSVNCPMGWMASSLNYASIVSSGSWGNFHEYHHNFQGFGVGDDGEVTNNSLNLVSYSLFTKISSARQLASYGGAGLSGWNCYTSATWTLQRVNQKAISSTNGLAVYATLLHNFGPEAYLKNAKGSNNTFWNNWADYTHQDMSYYVSLVNSFAVNSSASTVHSYADDKGYTSMFVPVASVYQTGRSYTYDGEKVYFDSMQPYSITYGEDFTVDLSPYTVNDGGQYVSGSVVMPDGFSYKIKAVKADGINGSFDATDDPFIYTYKPNKKQLLSGKIYVTLEVTNESATVNGVKFDVEDIDLVLEFEQSHESNRAILERTTYTYDSGKSYTDAVEAWDSGFKGYSSMVEGNNINPVQNSNTDVWFYPATDAYMNNPDTKDYVVPSNSVVVVSGKLYIEESGKYRIMLRGRYNAAMYLIYNKNDEDYTPKDSDYVLSGRIKDTMTNTVSANWRLKDSSGNDTYVDVKIEEDKSWVYFKLVLVTTNSPSTSYVGLGLAQWTVPLYNVDEDGNYYDANGNPVTADQASNVEPIMPTSISYASAYRADYEFPKEFTSEYFVTRNSNYIYSETSSSTTQKLVDYTNFVPLNDDEENNGIANLFTDRHYASNARRTITDMNPFIMTVDCQKTINANSLTVTGTHGATMGDFILYVGNSVDNLEPVATTITVTGNTVIATFEQQRFRYYRLYVMNTIDGNGGRNGNYLVITSLTFNYSIEGVGKMYSPDDDMFTYRGVGKWSMQRPISNYGHVYVGKNKASMEFTFEGSRFGILSSSIIDSTFEVTIDGKKVQSLDISPSGATVMSYISPLLSNGVHKVKVVCKGKANIDSFILYPNVEEKTE